MGVIRKRRPGSHIPADLAFRLWSSGRRRPRAENWVGRVDVVHGTNFVVPPSKRALRVVTVHDLSFLKDPATATAESAYYEALLLKEARLPTRFHVPTEAVAVDLDRFIRVPSDRVFVVMHGCPAVSETDDESLVVASSLTESQRYILAIGDVLPRKGYRYLISAFDAIAARQPDLRLIILGAAKNDDEFQRLQVQRASSPYCNRIIISGEWTPDPVKTALLKGASVVAYPSIEEGFGFPILEAQLCGVPVVAADVGGIPEVAGGGAVLVPAGNVDDLATSILDLVQDGATRQRIVSAGTANLTRFSWSHAAESIIRHVYSNP